MIYLVGDLDRKDLILMIAEQFQNDKILSLCLIDSAADDDYINKLKSLFDTVIINDTDDLELMFQSIRGVTDMIAVPGLVGLDFADVKAVMKDELEIIEVPNTKKNEKYEVIIGGTIILVLGIGVVLFATKKIK